MWAACIEPASFQPVCAVCCVCMQDRMREEYTYRLMMMSEEMEKWRQQAVQTSNAVLEVCLSYYYFV